MLEKSRHAMAILLAMSMTIVMFSSTATAQEATGDQPSPLELDDDRLRVLLQQIVDRSALPTFDQLGTATAALKASTEQFCSSPNEAALIETRQSWSSAMNAWQQTLPFLFGPTIEGQIDFSIYFYPVKKGVIRSLLTGDEPITVERVQRAGVGGQGLATLEYLLFDREQTDTQLVDAFSTAETHRCEYLQAAAAYLDQRARTIGDQWQDYATSVTHAGIDSEHFSTPFQPLELLFNGFYQASLGTTLIKLGQPLNLPLDDSDKPFFPYKLEAWRSGHSHENIQATTQGIRNVLVDGGLLDWLEAHARKPLADKLQQQLDQLTEIEPSQNSDLFTQLLQEDADVAVELYRRSRALSTTLRDEFAPLLNIQMGFTDFDGD